MRVLLILSVFLALGNTAYAQAPIEVYLDSTPVPLTQPARVIDDLIYLPLEPIALALNDTVSYNIAANTITILRSQDQSTVTYTPSTGAIVVNGVPTGSLRSQAPVIVAPGQTYLPPTVLANLLGVYISASRTSVNIARAPISSPKLLESQVNWRDIGIDYFHHKLGESSTLIVSPPQRLTDGAVVTPVPVAPLSGQVSQTSKNVPQITEFLQGDAGAHVGPLNFDGGCRLVGGTGGKFLNFNSAYLNAQNVATGTKLYGGDNVVLGVNSRIASGFPGRGVYFQKAGPRFTFTRFTGGEFSRGVPVGGGSIRFAYDRLINLEEVIYRPNRRWTSSLNFVSFKDTKSVVENIKQQGIYLDSLTIYNTPATKASANFVVGAGKRTKSSEGAAYVIDLRGQRTAKYGSINAQYDRYNPNFAHPLTGSSYVDRTDKIFGGYINLTQRAQIGATYSDTKQFLEARQPAHFRILNTSGSFTPFKNGPNITGNFTLSNFNPGTTGDTTPGTTDVSFPTAGLLLPGGLTPNANPVSGVVKSKLSTLSITDTIFGTNFNAAVTALTTEPENAESTTTLNYALAANRNFRRAGQVSVSSNFSNQDTFQILAAYTSPSFRGYYATFGPGWARAGDFKRFIFVAALNARLPVIGRAAGTVNRQLGQTTTTGLIERTTFFNKRRSSDGGGLGFVGPPQMVGQISGVVFENDQFPPANPLTTPRLAGIPIILDGYKDGARRTDALGRFKFERVAPGKHRVSVLLNQVPAELALISNPEYYVDTGVGTSVEVNFALAKLGQLQGAMSIVPGSGVSEHDLSNVRFYLEGTDFDTYPDPDGEFRLTDVRPGTYILKSDVSAADSDLEVSPAELSVRIGSGQSISGLKFQLGYKARPVIKKEF